MRRGRESFIETMRNSINATPAAAAYVTYFTYSKNGLLVSSKLRRRVKSELSDHISVCVRFLCSLELCMSLIGEFVELSWRLLQPRCSSLRLCSIPNPKLPRVSVPELWREDFNQHLFGFLSPACSSSDKHQEKQTFPPQRVGALVHMFTSVRLPVNWQ